MKVTLHKFDVFYFCIDLFFVCSAAAVTHYTVTICFIQFICDLFTVAAAVKVKHLFCTPACFLEKTVRTVLSCRFMVGLCVGEVTFLSGFFFSVPVWRHAVNFPAPKQEERSYGIKDHLGIFACPIHLPSPRQRCVVHCSYVLLSCLYQVMCACTDPIHKLTKFFLWICRPIWLWCNSLKQEKIAPFLFSFQVYPHVAVQWMRNRLLGIPFP